MCVEWVDSWHPIVDLVGTLLGETIAYQHCDVTKPLDDEENCALWDPTASYDILIFSHVLLECGRGGGEAALALLRDLWTRRQEISHVLVLDAGQARGKRQEGIRPLAGSLRAVDALAADLGAHVVRIDGRTRTGLIRTQGLLLSRTDCSTK